MLFVGVDIGATNIKVGFFDEKKQKTHSFVIKTKRDKKADFVIEEIVKSIKQELKTKDFSLEQIKKIGICCPGNIDEDLGVCLFSPNLKWYNVEIKKIFLKDFDCEVKVWHDVKAGAFAELNQGSLKKVKFGLYIALGTGLGAACISNGLVENNRKNVVSELGHVVLHLNGKQCSCGRKGCVEQYCSVSALLEEAQKRFDKTKFKKEITLSDIFDLEKKGDVTAKYIVKNFLFNLCQFLINIINASRPEKIVIGGGLSYFLEDKMSKINEYTKKHSYPSPIKTKIETGHFKNDASTLGCVLL